MASYPDNADNPRVDVDAYLTAKDLVKQPANDDREHRALVMNTASKTKRKLFNDTIGIKKGSVMELKRVVVSNPYEQAFLAAVEAYEQHADQIRYNVLAGHHESCIAYGLWPLVEVNGMDGPTIVLFTNATNAAIRHTPTIVKPTGFVASVAANLYSIRSSLGKQGFLGKQLQEQIDLAIRLVMQTGHI